MNIIFTAMGAKITVYAEDIPKYCIFYWTIVIFLVSPWIIRVPFLPCIWFQFTFHLFSNSLLTFVKKVFLEFCLFLEAVCMILLVECLDSFSIIVSDRLSRRSNFCARAVPKPWKELDGSIRFRFLYRSFPISWQSSGGIEFQREILDSISRYRWTKHWRCLPRGRVLKEYR